MYRHNKSGNGDNNKSPVPHPLRIFPVSRRNHSGITFMLASVTRMRYDCKHE